MLRLPIRTLAFGLTFPLLHLPASSLAGLWFGSPRNGTPWTGRFPKSTTSATKLVKLSLAATAMILITIAVSLASSFACHGLVHCLLRAGHLCSQNFLLLLSWYSLKRRHRRERHRPIRASTIPRPTIFSSFLVLLINNNRAVLK